MLLSGLNNPAIPLKCLGDYESPFINNCGLVGNTLCIHLCEKVIFAETAFLIRAQRGGQLLATRGQPVSYRFSGTVYSTCALRYMPSDWTVFIGVSLSFTHLPDSTDIVDCRSKLILGLIWTLILHYSITIPLWEGEVDHGVRSYQPYTSVASACRSNTPQSAESNFLLLIYFLSWTFFVLIFFNNFPRISSCNALLSSKVDLEALENKD